ncbi:hypothetical protein LINGRAHAP2_LOCUS20230 [Linum grandiflorum]
MRRFLGGLICVTFLIKPYIFFFISSPISRLSIFFFIFSNFLKQLNIASSFVCYYYH